MREQNKSKNASLGIGSSSASKKKEEDGDNGGVGGGAQTKLMPEERREAWGKRIECGFLLSWPSSLAAWAERLLVLLDFTRFRLV